MTIVDLEEIERRALQLEPWVNGFEYNGVRYARGSELSYLLGQAPEDRAQSFFAAFPESRRILELGALEGADTLALARYPGTSIVAIEGRSENLARAEFVMEVHGVTNAELRLGDVEKLDFSLLGHFDAVLCAGLLYHVQEPWTLLDNIAKVSGNLFLSTHYWGTSEGLEEHSGLAVKPVLEEHPEPQARGLSREVRWLNRASLMGALASAGFREVDVAHEQVRPGVCDLVVICRKDRR
jgi:SAM-dependent methyltransferase